MALKQTLSNAGLPPELVEEVLGQFDDADELLSALCANPRAGKQWLGDAYHDLVSTLRDAAGKGGGHEHPLPRAPLGARLDPPPTIVSKGRRKKRDELFEELVALERSGGSSPSARARKKWLEEEIERLGR